VKSRAALTARCGETARRGLVAFLEYGSALEWLIGAGKTDPLAQAARRLGSPMREAHDPGRSLRRPAHRRARRQHRAWRATVAMRRK
jgi:hypothetical protein